MFAISFLKLYATKLDIWLMDHRWYSSTCEHRRKNDGSDFITKQYSGTGSWWLSWHTVLFWIKHIINRALISNLEKLFTLHSPLIMTIFKKKKKKLEKKLEKNSDAAVISNFSDSTCLKPTYMTSPQPSPAKVILSGLEWVNAEQLEALQPFGLL